MFSTSCNHERLKANLKLCMQRLSMLKKKKTEITLKARKEIAEYIKENKCDRARIKVELIIREDYLVEAMEIIEMYCDLLVARFGLLKSQRSQLDPCLEESIATLIWVTPRLQSETQEFRVISEQLTAKYGKEFSKACLANCLHNVNSKVMQKLNVAAPPCNLVELYMVEISRAFNVPFEPDEKLLNGGPDGSGNPNAGSPGGNVLIDLEPEATAPTPHGFFGVEPSPSTDTGIPPLPQEFGQINSCHKIPPGSMTLPPANPVGGLPAMPSHMSPEVASDFPSGKFAEACGEPPAYEPLAAPSYLPRTNEQLDAGFGGSAPSSGGAGAGSRGGIPELPPLPSVAPVADTIFPNLPVPTNDTGGGSASLPDVPSTSVGSSQPYPALGTHNTDNDLDDLAARFSELKKRK